jgi:hypothetical protein
MYLLDSLNHWSMGFCNTAEKCLRMRQHYWNLPCERGAKSKLKMKETWSDFDVLPFLWKCKRNNERDNLKTRNKFIE